jgi:adenine-specific DNA-methyltransferase
VELVLSPKDVVDAVEDAYREMGSKTATVPPQRYYDNGDYVSKRRNRNGTYAIPYDGREVIFHWANRDQYYAKSGELLQDELLRIWHETTKTVVFITHTLMSGLSQ